MTESNETNKEILNPTEFVVAISNDDINMLRQILATSPSINFKDTYGNRPLHLAVLYDSLQVLEYLLSIDTIDIDAKNVQHCTPLNITLDPSPRRKQTSARHGVQKYMNFLHICGSELIPTFGGCRPELINLLIKAGADINTKDYLGNTLLHKSVYYQRLDVMYMLLYYNADTNILNDQYQTPFMLALISNHQEMVKLLMKYTDIDMNQCLLHNHFDRYIKIISFHPYVDNFRALWVICGNKTLCYTLDKLNKLVEKYDQWTDVVMEYIKIIFDFDTDQFKPLDHNKECICIQFLVRLFANGLMDREMVQKFICVLLMYNCPLNIEDIHHIFGRLGYRELIKITLHMDIPLADFDRYICGKLFPVIIYDVRRTIDEIFKNVMSYFYSQDYNNQFLTHFYYFSNHRLNCAFSFMVVKTSENDAIFKKMKSLPNIPKLLELSRNKLRDYIISKYNITRTSQYYTIVNNLDIANTYKRILTFETALYL